MSKQKSKVAKVKKNPYIIIVPYGQYKKGETIHLSKEGARYLKSIHKI